ncbi:H-NS histone family protein [Robbsia sp. KACC 23696]|uniref:H-NS histone family protein n=1 Tax=Robbsia sp. KACC 23696 TaxID=3149231 RepID=UPI00325A9BF3
MPGFSLGNLLSATFTDGSECFSQGRNSFAKFKMKADKKLDLAALLEQRAALDKEIESQRTAARHDALIEVRKLISLFDLTASEVGLGPKVGRPARSANRQPVAPRYRDPESGTTWSGRGKPPKWILGKDRELFAI